MTRPASVPSRLASISALLALAACTTTAGGEGAAPPAPQSAGGQPPPGIFFSYSFDHGANTPPMRECKIRFFKGATRSAGPTTVEATLKPDKDRVLIKVPVGRYRVVDATCQNGRRFGAVEALPPIDIQGDRVTFLGNLELTQAMASKAREADTLKIDRRRTAKNTETFNELGQRQLQGLWWLEPKT